VSQSANKDRPSYRDAFVAMRETYLQQADGLMIVDVVIVRQANLPDNLLVGLDGMKPAGLEAGF
jgi:hypothetical protein